MELQFFTGRSAFAFWLILVYTFTFITADSEALGLYENSPIVIQMNNWTRITEGMQFVCTAYKVDSSKILYIRQFEIVNTTKGFHHMVLVGCSKLPSNIYVKKTGICATHDVIRCKDYQVIHSWVEDDRNPNKVPIEAGFRLGPKSKVNYLIVQAHYAVAQTAGLLDESGYILRVTSKEPKYLMGQLSAETHRKIGSRAIVYSIPPNSKGFQVGGSCSAGRTKPIFIFAVQRHTHAWGIETATYVYQSKSRKLVPLFRHDPQTLQQYYYLDQIFKVYPRDIFLFRCIYNTTGAKEAVIFGGNETNEMCGFHLWYYTKSRKPDDLKISCGVQEHGKYWKLVRESPELPMPTNMTRKQHGYHRPDRQN